MTDKDKLLIAEVDLGIITAATFIKLFSVDITADSDFVNNEMKAAIASGDAEEIRTTLILIWLSGAPSKYTAILNELLLDPKHSCHQQIARALQDIASPSSVPFVRKVLESNFDYFPYTGSDPDAMAKWFSWLLYSIGTTEAIDLIKEYSNSDNEDIRNEMRYRLTYL